MTPGGAIRGALAAAVLLLLASRVDAQIFFAAKPDPPFTIGPLMIRARVAEEGNAVTVNVLWSLVPAAGMRPDDAAQDLYLLWPGEVRDGGVAGGRDSALSKFAEDRGFSVIGEGRLPLVAQSWAQAGRGSAEPMSAGAPFVVFVLEGGALGLSPPATLIRIPWTPRLAEAGWLLDLTMRVPGIVKPGKVTWAEHLFVGGRFLLTLSYNEVRERPLFPMYLSLRDRVIRLADAPAELAVTFAHSDRLKIDQVFPPTSIRRLSETEESTEVVSLFLDKTDGVTPQHLAVQFGYFSKVQAWALVLIPTLFFVLGQAIGPVIGRSAVRLVNLAGTRVHLGRWNGVPRPRESGVVLGRDALEKIVPGETTAAEVVRLCGPVAEQLEQYPASDRRTLVYRGRRDVPRTRRVFGWLSTVAHWEVEQHEVRVEIAADVVRDVQATIRSFRAGTAEPLAGELDPPSGGR